MWRACNLTAITHSSTDSVVHLFAFPSWGTRVQSPGGYLCETGILLLILSRTIDDHNRIDHCGLIWGGLRPEPPLGRRANIVKCNPTGSHIAFLSRFHARCRSFFWLHNWHSRLLGGSPVKSLQSHCIHTQFHWFSGPPVCFPSWGTRVQCTGGYLCETGILLLALSRYNHTLSTEIPVYL